VISDTPTELGELPVFVAVVEERGFRAAGRRLGVSGSAVSQTIGHLEERLGIALFERTTRTVRPTEAGERLYAGVRPALEELGIAVAGARELGVEPSGTLRLNVSSGAESVLQGSLLTRFLARHPRVRLEVVVTEHTGDIVAAGYDAAVGLGEVIARGMIALPVSDDLRMIVVGAPEYLERRGTPRHPRELVGHDIINWTPGAGATPYRWEFTEDGKDFEVEMDARVLSTDPDLILRLALAGLGLAILYDQSVQEHVAAGRLVAVLQEFCPPFPGFHLYFPRRRNRSAALRALVDFVRGEIPRPHR
jgi:DNA-binding transcriptional LysR family regulator